MPGFTVAEAAWDGFLSGPENAMALASAIGVARADENLPCLLVLHGPAGVGKSRLLEGLLLERLQRHPTHAGALITGEDFATACTQAAQQEGGWTEFRGRFRELDFLGIDDVQKLEKNVLALGELVHTLDALEARGASIAVTAKVAPSNWKKWPPRLLDRFLAGLSVKLDPPGLALRRRFVLEAARRRSLALAADAVDFLAESADGFRAIEGWMALLKLATHREGRPLTRAVVEPLISSDSLPVLVQVDTIAAAIAQQFGVSLRDLRGPSRRPLLVEPRHLAIYLTRLHTHLSYNAIGTYFGGRDSKTVRHACQMASERLDDSPALQTLVEAVRRSWQPLPSLDQTA